MTKAMFDAIACDEDVKVERLLEHGTLNFNSRNARKNGFMGAALAFTHAKPTLRRARIIALLSDDPRSDLSDDCTHYHYSAFFQSCFYGDDYSFRVFFDDPRAEPYALKTFWSERCDSIYPLGQTALYFATIHGHINVVKWWIASGRPLIVDPTLADQPQAMLEAAKCKKHDWMQPSMVLNKHALTKLLEEYKANPVAVAHSCRLETGWCGPMAAAVFALVIFYSDELLQQHDNKLFQSRKDARFFGIAVRLPMELQMVLCNAVAGSGASIIQSRHIDPAFKALTRALNKGTTYRRVLDMENLVQKE